MILLFVPGGSKGYAQIVVGPTGREPRRCPECGGAMHRHGSYERGMDELHGKTTWLRILRMLCSACGVTHAVLPWFLAPSQRMSTPCLEHVARR